MPQVTEAALKDRARSLLVAMTERSRWVYALPSGDTFDTVCQMIAADGLPKVADDAKGKVVRFETEDEATAFVVFENAELDVVLVEAEGDGAVATMQKLLEKTGFYAQSKLWGQALDIGGGEATRSLRILAHMAVAWDEDWTDLMLLHLASPDAVTRQSALVATTLAAMVAREPGPAIELLEEAKRREKFPKLAEAIGESLGVLKAADGQPVDLTATAPPSDAADG
jgi:hypothetical protein